MNVPTCTLSEYEEALELTAKYALDKPPAGWKVHMPFPPHHPMHGVEVYHRQGDRLSVILTASRWPGDTVTDRVWLHVSLSRPHSMPTYENMCDVKELFIGPDRRAYQIFAERSQHVNIHQYCLHLWCVVEGEDNFPAFGKDGTI